LVRPQTMELEKYSARRVAEYFIRHSVVKKPADFRLRADR
jgi:hypothetical protein